MWRIQLCLIMCWLGYSAIAAPQVHFPELLRAYDSLLNHNKSQAQRTLLLLNKQLSQRPPATTSITIWLCNTRWYQASGDCNKARICADRAWQLAQVNQAGFALAALAKGAAFRCSRNTDSALFYYITAEKYALKSNDTPVLIRSSFYIGHVWSELGRYDRAGGYYDRSNLLANQYNDKEFMVRNALAKASNLADRGLIKQALPDMQKALQYSVENNMFTLTATASNNLGLICTELGQYEEASRYFNQSLNIQQQLGNQQEVFNEYNNLAMVSMYRQRYHDAIKLLLKADSLAHHMGGHPMWPEVYHNLALCYENLHDYRNAYRYKTAQKLVSDSLRNIELRKHTEQLQEEYEAEKRQLEIVNLRQENEVNDLKNKIHVKQRDILIGIAAGILMAALLLFFILRQKVKNARELNAKNEQIHRQQMDEVLQRSELQAIRTMIETQEKERQRIAADLHDRVGSMLSAIKLHFGVFKPGHSGSPHQYNKVSDMLDEACEEIRLVSHNLVSGLLSTFGLVPALRDLLDALTQSSGITFHMEVHGIDQRVPAEVETNVYRVFQELLNNTLRHAKANRVDIELSLFNQQLTCIYSDNGIGFSTTLSGNGMGLKNMHARIEKLGGSMHIDSGRGNGSTFVFKVKIP